MCRPERDHSIHAEPHLTGAPGQVDPSEAKADELLNRERLAADAGEDRATHSVFDEPAIFPHREPVLIDQDWLCRRCGYNLRGLMTGHPCPECGAVELYEPPRPGELTYHTWLKQQTQYASSRRRWGLTVLLTLLGGPFAIIGAFVSTEWAGVLSAVLYGPLVEELMKVAAAMMLVERRSYLIHDKRQLATIVVGTALLFAVIENAIYLLVYIPNPTPMLVAWRWTVLPVVHVGCSLIALQGVVAVWARARLQQRRPRVTLALPWIIAAVCTHAAYNACVMALGAMGYGF